MIRQIYACQKFKVMLSRWKNAIEALVENQSETFVGIVRSGQVVKAEGDLVVIGDVNPNGRVVAAGSIYVLGRLKGIAHAGANGIHKRSSPHHGLKRRI